MKYILLMVLVSCNFVEDDGLLSECADTLDRHYRANNGENLEPYSVCDMSPYYDVCPCNLIKNKGK